MTASLQRKINFSCIVVLLLTVSYARLYQLGFTAADDKWALLDNPLVSDVTFNSDYFKELLTSFNGIQYSPLNTLYYSLIYKINGFDPYYYHLFSLLIHLANAGLVFLLCKKILTLFKIDNASSIAYVTCLFWIVCPINVESVVWISASKIVLYSFFSLMCMLYFLRAITHKTRLNLCWSLFFFILSFFCKEQAVMVPVMALAFLLCYNKHTGHSQGRIFLIYFPIMFMMAIVFGIITLKANVSIPGEVSKYPFLPRLILSFYCLFFYLYNLFIPVNLHYNYSFPIMPGESVPFIYYSFPLLFLVILFCLKEYIGRLKQNNFYMFCFLGFFIQLGLCLQIVPMRRPAIMADRYMYLPSLFLILPISVVLLKYFQGGEKKIKIVMTIMFCLYLLVISLYSNILVDNWNNISI